MRILYLPLDFLTWAFGRSQSFLAQTSLLYGMQHCTPDVTYACVMGNAHPVWMHLIIEKLKNEKFDIVWTEVAHTNITQEWADWLVNVAPVRVAFMGESLQFFEDSDSWLAGRQEMVESRLKLFTHAVAVDEKDVARFNSTGLIKAKWYPSCVPERFIKEEANFNRENSAGFFGSVYGARKDILEHPSIQPILRVHPIVEESNGLADQFNAVNVGAFYLSQYDPTCVLTHGRLMRDLRSGIFNNFLKYISSTCSSSVNLPSIFKGYAGRVIEAMATGVPVISWDIPDRPINRNLFEDGKEILLFDKDNIDQLRQHILDIQQTDLGTEIANNALKKVRENHTSERFIKETIDWIYNEQRAG